MVYPYRHLIQLLLKRRNANYQPDRASLHFILTISETDWRRLRVFIIQVFFGFAFTLPHFDRAKEVELNG